MQPVITSRASFGPVVRRAESVKRIMQKNRRTEHSTSPSVSTSSRTGQPLHQTDIGSSAVVTEKARSVKSIVGMFDQQPAIHAALAKVKANQANGMLAEQGEAHFSGAGSRKETAPPQTDSGRSDRNHTQVVHIAKFIQIETPTKQTVNYSDAQTSPMQLSPTEKVMQNGRPAAVIAKAETFNGGPKPKLAIITSSTSSSYLSNDVFTPCTDSMDSPVFEGELPYHRADSSTRTHYSDSVASDGYDLAHNSYIPNAHAGLRVTPQHIHLNNQVRNMCTIKHR